MLNLLVGGMAKKITGKTRNIVSFQSTEAMVRQLGEHSSQLNESPLIKQKRSDDV